MRTVKRLVIGGIVVFALGGGAVRAEEAAPAKPAMDPQMQAAMEKMKELGGPSEGHKALEPLAGAWTYTGQWWMSPEDAPHTMTGSATNTLIFGGRFLKQEVRGDMGEGHPVFEGLGILGYDNMRKEYQSVWFDNMMTGMMRGTGQFDAATKTLADQGEFSCPMTGETNRSFRSVWKVDDASHTTYESYSKTPEGKEFKSMELRYTRQ